MANKDPRRFTDVVDNIESAEQDVDKVLDAAKLQRTPKPDNSLSAEQKYNLMIGVILLVGAIAAMFCFYHLVH